MIRPTLTNAELVAAIGQHRQTITLARARIATSTAALEVLTLECELRVEELPKPTPCPICDGTRIGKSNGLPCRRCYSPAEIMGMAGFPMEPIQ